MQADKTVLSLRPGGGSRGGSRVFGPRFEAAAANFDIPVLRPRGGGGAPSLKTGESRFEGRERICYTREQLLQLREGGPNPALTKAEVPWSARRGHLSEEERVLKTVKGLLNKPTPEKFDLLKGQLIDSGITLNKLTSVLSPSANASSSKPSDEGTLPLQRIDPPRVDPDEVPTDLPVVGGSALSDKGKSPQAVKSTSDVLQFSKAADEDADAVLRSIQDVFTSWEQLKASVASRSSSASRPSALSTAFSEENMAILKQSVLEYISFIDMDIINASVPEQRDKFELLSAKMTQALELPSLKISSDFKLTLKIIHSEISSLLAKNVELKAKKTQHLRAANEKESLFQEIEKTNSELNEISFEVMVEDSLMMSLIAEMKELQAKMYDCKARLVAKKHTASQGVELSKSLLERYSKLDVNEEVMTELSAVAQKQRNDWEKLREQMRSMWGKL